MRLLRIPRPVALGRTLTHRDELTDSPFFTGDRACRYGGVGPRYGKFFGSLAVIQPRRDDDDVTESALIGDNSSEQEWVRRRTSFTYPERRLDNSTASGCQRRGR